MLCALILGFSACHSYRVAPDPWERNLNGPPGQLVRVHERSGARTNLVDVNLATDSLIGVKPRLRERKAIALADVSYVELGTTDKARTAFIAVSTGVLALALTLLLTLDSL